MKYDLTYLTTEGWKQYKVDTEKTPEEISQYLESDYVKKVHAEPTNNVYGYLPLETQIREHPTYDVLSDWKLNYFRTTKDTWVDAECASIKKDWDEHQKRVERVEQKIWGKKRSKNWQNEMIRSFYRGR